MWLDVLFLLLGALLNSFNLLATLGQPSPLQPASLIIGLISSANVLLDATTLAMHAVESQRMFQRAPLPLYLPVLLAVWLGTSAVSFWSVALLSALYCVTVVRSSSPLLLAVRRNVGAVVRAGLPLMLVSSYLVFLPLLTLQRRPVSCSSNRPTELNATTGASLSPPQTGPPQNVTENATCVSSVLGLPFQLNTYAYMASFLSYMLLLPVCTMLPTSLRLVFYLCSHARSMRAHPGGGGGGPDSYLLVCGGIVALVWLFVCTTITVSIFYIHSALYSNVNGDVLFYTFSFYCLASAALLSASNLPLRRCLRRLFCRPCCPGRRRAP